MKFFNFRVFELCIALTLGTLLSHWLSIPEEILYGLLLSWVLAVYIYFRDRNKFHTSAVFPLLSFLLFLQIGYWNHQLRQPIYKSHALHKLAHPEKTAIW